MYIQNRLLWGVLRKRCSAICILSTWQIPRGKFIFSKVAGYYSAPALLMNVCMGVSQSSWLRISPAYTCNSYSFQEHLFNRTVIVAVLVSRCLSTVWLIQRNFNLSLTTFYLESSILPCFKKKKRKLFKKHLWICSLSVAKTKTKTKIINTWAKNNIFLKGYTRSLHQRRL